MRLRSIIFAVAVALTVVGAVALAQQVRDGSTTPTPAISYWPMGGTDGTTNRVVKLDPNGILRITEEYPAEYQTQTVPLWGDTAGLVINHAIRNLGISWTDYPFSRRCVQVTIHASTPAVNTYLLLYGSDDNALFYPVIDKRNRYGLNRQAVLGIGTAANFATAWLDGAAAARDTSDVGYVGWVIDSAMLSTATQTTLRFNIPDDVYIGRYGALYIRSDSTAASAHGEVDNAQYYGRMR